MSRRRIVLLVVVIVLLAVAILAAAVWPRHSAVLSAPDTVTVRQLRSAVAGYQTLLEPVRPAKFYGKQLTPIRCVSLMKSRDARLETVADGDALAGARSSWSTLSGLIRQEQALSGQFGEGTVPTSCTGETGYWQVRSCGGDTYVVRAAVVETVGRGRWDATTGTLVDLGRMTYDEASVADYTLRRIDGVWKVVDVRDTGLSYNRGSGIHPDSA